MTISHIIKEFEAKFNGIPREEFCNEGMEECTCAQQEWLQTKLSSLLEEIAVEIHDNVSEDAAKIIRAYKLTQ